MTKSKRILSLEEMAAIDEKKFSSASLLEETELFLNDFFACRIERSKDLIKMSFANGQNFELRSIVLNKERARKE